MCQGNTCLTHSDTEGGRKTALIKSCLQSFAKTQTNPKMNFLWAWSIAQLVEYLPAMHSVLGSMFSFTEPSVVVHACNQPNTLEVEIGSGGRVSSSVVNGVSDQRGLYEDPSSKQADPKPFSKLFCKILFEACSQYEKEDTQMYGLRASRPFTCSGDALLVIL